MVTNNGESSTPVRPSLKIALVAIFASTCVGAGYLLALIPNVEIFTMLVFLGGLLFGKKIGMLNAFVSSIIYFVFNLYGASPVPLLVVQLAAYSLLGLLGGFLTNVKVRKIITRRSQLVFGIIGAGFVFMYTFIADIVFSFIMGMNFFAWFLQGIIFTSILVACNAITFGFLLPLIILPLDKYRIVTMFFKV